MLVDARMILAQGGRPWLIMLMDTSQSRLALNGIDARPVAWLQQQWETLTQHETPAAIKVGAVANPEQATWLARRLRDFGGPVVLDPVLQSSTGGRLASPEALQELTSLATILTPNRQEAAALFDIDPHQPRWTSSCTTPVLVTGTDHAADQEESTITHHLLTATGQHAFHVARQPGGYRGTGCLLASALSCALAAGQDLVPACEFALQTVSRWIEAAQHFDDGIHLPQEPR